MMSNEQWARGNEQKSFESLVQRLVLKAQGSKPKAILFVLFLLMSSIIFAQGVPGVALEKNLATAQVQSALELARSVLFTIMILFVVLAALLYMFGQFFGAEMRARANVYMTNLIMGTAVAAVIYAFAPFVMAWILELTDIGGKPALQYAIYISLLSVILSALTVMISRALDIRNLEQFAKTELVFAASTMFLIVAIVILLPVVEDVLVQMSANMLVKTYDPLVHEGAIIFKGEAISSAEDLTHKNAKIADVAKLYMAPATFCMNAAMDGLSFLAIPLEAWTSTYMEIFMSEHATGFGFKFMVERLNNAISVLTFYRWAAYLIFHTFTFIKHYGLLLLTIGIALRAFPLTRGAGAYMIALSLGLYFVFPFSYIMVSTVMANFTFDKNLVEHNPAAAPEEPNYICNLPDLPRDFETCGFMDYVKTEDAKSYLEANRSGISSFLDYVSLDLFKSMSLSICFIPLVAMTATLSFVLSSTSLFGGQIPEIGRGLIKLV